MKERSPKELWDRILVIFEKPIPGNSLGAGVFLGIRIAVRVPARRA